MALKSIFEVNFAGAIVSKFYIKTKSYFRSHMFMEQYENKLRTEGLFDFPIIMIEGGDSCCLPRDEGFRFNDDRR